MALANRVRPLTRRTDMAVSSSSDGTAPEGKGSQSKRATMKKVVRQTDELIVIVVQLNERREPKGLKVKENRRNNNEEARKMKQPLPVTVTI